MNDRSKRFPGVGDGWARFDGPAGTQMADTSITAMAAWAASGNNANCGGTFGAADACDELLDVTRRTAASPTVAFTVDGVRPDDDVRRTRGRPHRHVGRALLPVEVVDQLGLADRGGVVRAGVVAYITDDDVARLLASVERIAAP